MQAISPADRTVFAAPPHRERFFTGLPDASTAAGLLTELAAAPCAFSPVSADRPLALYGAGNLGRLAHEFLTAVGHDITMVIDRDARRVARAADWPGVPVLHPDDVSESAKRVLRVAVSVVTSPYVPIERSLRELGFADVVPFYDLAESFRGLHPLSNGWFAPPLAAMDRNNAAEVLARWHDDVSRAHHLQFLAWRRLREEWHFAAAPVVTCDRYFIADVVGVLNDDEVLLDAGAYHGSVAETFVGHTNGAFRRVVLVEPDPANRLRLEDNLHRSLPDDPRIAVYDCALAADDSEALFHDGLGYASQLAPTGKTRITTRRLDALGLSPTFIKLHLEGGELAALHGARETLRSERPIVAATVYHNADGIWRTPFWVMQALPDYRFLFRSHGWCGTGAVVYAIPNERRAVRRDS
jgi:FkbM family methyltransferase